MGDRAKDPKWIAETLRAVAEGRMMLRIARGAERTVSAGMLVGAAEALEAAASPDPTMPKAMPPEARQAIETVLGFRGTASAQELWDAIRAALESQLAPLDHEGSARRAAETARRLKQPARR